MATNSLQSYLNQAYQFVKSVAPQINLSPGTVFSTFLDAIGTQVYNLSVAFNVGQSNAFLSTAAGQFLDALGFDHGLTRIGAAVASGTLQVSRPSAITFVQIPSGTVFGTNNIDPTTNVFFSSTAAVTLSPGQLTASVPVSANTAGAVSNVNPGTITLIISNLQEVNIVINNSSMSGGVDQETDGAFRFRIYASLAPQNSVTRINAAALAVASVHSAASFDQQDSLGNFLTYACNSTGALPTALNTSVFNAVSAAKSLGSTGTVLAPTSTAINISYQYAVASGFTASSVQAQVNSIITAYMGALTIGQALRPYDLMTQIIGNAQGTVAVPGLLNFQVLAPSGTLSPNPWQLYTLGNILATQITA